MVLLSFAICLFVNSGGNPVAVENMRTEIDTIPIAKFDPMLALPSDRWFWHGSNTQNCKEDCIWEGSAPWCNGRCNRRWYQVEKNKNGDGNPCIIGTKVKCCRVICT